MLHQHEHLDDFPELKLVRDSCGICEYVVADDLPADLAARILLALSPDRELGFFDPNYPSPSDPGAYVSARKTVEGFRCGIGNHGWSQQLPVESFDWLAAYLQRCLPCHQPGRSRETLRLTPIIPAA